MHESFSRYHYCTFSQDSVYMTWCSDDRSQISASARAARTSSHLPCSSISNLQQQKNHTLLKKNIYQWHHHTCSVRCNDDECVIIFYLHTVSRFLLSTALIRATAFLRAPLKPRFNDAMIVSFWCTAVYFLSSFSLLMLWLSLWLTLTWAIEMQ